jgi:hypothetical protein
MEICEANLGSKPKAGIPPAPLFHNSEFEEIFFIVLVSKSKKIFIGEIRVILG